MKCLHNSLITKDFSFILEFTKIWNNLTVVMPNQHEVQHNTFNGQ